MRRYFRWNPSGIVIFLGLCCQKSDNETVIPQLPIQLKRLINSPTTIPRGKILQIFWNTTNSTFNIIYFLQSRPIREIVSQKISIQYFFMVYGLPKLWGNFMFWSSEFSSPSPATSLCIKKLHQPSLGLASFRFRHNPKLNTNFFESHFLGLIWFQVFLIYYF